MFPLYNFRYFLPQGTAAPSSTLNAGASYYNPYSVPAAAGTAGAPATGASDADAKKSSSALSDLENLIQKSNAYYGAGGASGGAGAAPGAAGEQK
jgi:hypothetical protein